MFGKYLYRRKYRDESVPHIPETLRPDISAEVDVSIAVIVLLISVPSLMLSITVSITVQFSIHYGGVRNQLCIRGRKKKLEEVIGSVIAIVCVLL